MKVEELQSIWIEMSDELEKQKKLTHKIIMQMTQERYTNQLQKIAKYEGIGALFCFAIALYILINFLKLDTWYLQLCGVFTLGFLLVMPTLVLRSIRNMKRINIVKGTYTENISAYSKARNQFLFLQRIGIGLAFVLMITTLPVAGKIMNGKDLFAGNQGWYWYIPVMLIFLVLFSRWGYGKYKRITQSAEQILMETQDS
ncbi:MAG: hypothetical protein ABF295_02100 [Flavobacteriaceae bacterium]